MNYSRSMGLMWGIILGASGACAFFMHPSFIAFAALAFVGCYWHREVT